MGAVPSNRTPLFARNGIRMKSIHSAKGESLTAAIRMRQLSFFFARKSWKWPMCTAASRGRDRTRSTRPGWHKRDVRGAQVGLAGWAGWLGLQRLPEVGIGRDPHGQGGTNAMSGAHRMNRLAGLAASLAGWAYMGSQRSGSDCAAPFGRGPRGNGAAAKNHWRLFFVFFVPHRRS